ncbi:MAG: hypothetical protein A2W99_04760 [Bacteroidetes bacterium GWF2_33_16]|nr:MAG: hypothetical protein A2X00_17280 [Bacteroidetes bacterium GWE2_32_14]OFY05980.1 MAG: hypothetical protein A2W99_04760 [Bacteroidetes bacterium GWF2_33_16]
MLRKTRWIKFLIGFIIIAILVWSIDINLLSAFKSIKYLYFLGFALIIPLIINPIISNNRWKIFLKVQGIDEHFFSLVKINFVSVFFGILLPSSTGFDAIRIYIIEKRNKKQKGGGGASVVIERLLGFYILSVIGIIGSIFALKHQLSKDLLFSIIAINICITLVFIIFKNQFLFHKINILFSKVKRFKRLNNYLSLLYSSLNSFPLKNVLLSTIPLILLFQFSSIICGFLIFKAFNVNIPFFYHLAFLPLISIISIIPVSISGFGLREGGFVYFYGLLGIDGNICFLSSLIYYFILMIIPAIIGFLIYVFGPDQFKIIKNELDKKND